MHGLTVVLLLYYSPPCIIHMRPMPARPLYAGHIGDAAGDEGGGAGPLPGAPFDLLPGANAGLAVVVGEEGWVWPQVQLWAGVGEWCILVLACLSWDLQMVHSCWIIHGRPRGECYLLAGDDDLGDGSQNNDDVGGEAAARDGVQRSAPGEAYVGRMHTSASGLHGGWVRVAAKGHTPALLQLALHCPCGGLGAGVKHVASSAHAASPPCYVAHPCPSHLCRQHW